MLQAPSGSSLIATPSPAPHKPKAPPEAVASVFTPLFETQASGGGGQLGLLVGIAAVTGARNGDTIVVRCTAGCSHPLREIVHVRKHHDAHGTIAISPPLALRGTTRLEIELMAPKHITRFVQYRFGRTGRGVIAHVLRKGCLSASGRPGTCP
jgi:hypothetical protein